MDPEQLNSVLKTAGVVSTGGDINWPNIAGNLIFSSIGLVAFLYGKKEKSAKPMIIGIALMIYPYFVLNAVLMFAIGAGLCAALYFWKD